LYRPARTPERDPIAAPNFERTEQRGEARAIEGWLAERQLGQRQAFAGWIDGEAHGVLADLALLVARGRADGQASVVVVVGEREHGIDQREDQRGHVGKLAARGRSDQSGVAPLGLLGGSRGRC
jgi:hypothetical protein